MISGRHTSRRRLPIVGDLRCVLLHSLEVIAALALAGCAATRPGVYEAADADAKFSRVTNGVPEGVFVPETQAPSTTFASTNEIAKFSNAADQGYKLGPGDKFSFVVRGRPDISREEVIVSPDGEIALPRAGIVNVSGHSLSVVTEELTTLLRRFYEDPEVTLVMRQYANNKVFVLGRVAVPGAVNFSGRGTLLEALALSGGLPTDTAKSFLSRCMIVRGNDMVIWIDLRELLENGNMALNARLQNGDIIFIPQSEDQLAYVMGQVVQPGVMVLRSSMTVLDAVMSRGGPTRDADTTEVILARQVGGKGVIERIDLDQIVGKGDLRKNYVLKDGDIIYLGQRGASQVNYFLTRLLPSMSVVDFALRSAESFGAMAELRKKLWGQEGFVGTGVTSQSSSSSAAGP